VVYAGGTPSGNGDVNGSGAIDISDCVYTLLYLFKNGLAPEPIVCTACDACCPPCPLSGLVATGQTKCYRGATPWGEIDCADSDNPGQDGFYQKGCPVANRFVDNLDGTVTDTCMGLMWQKGSVPGYAWQRALQYCEALEFAGHSDWRLPNVRELQSIVDYGRSMPSIDDGIFEVETEWYWSSSTQVYDDLSNAWGVSFDGGGVAVNDKEAVGYVRAVRG
jgi:hypothetical protein